ncbi:MAG: hypothetical protein RR968_04245, partial [Vagococcus sp.]
SLLNTHFSISGPRQKIEEISSQFDVFSVESLGDFKTIYVSAKRPLNLPPEITVNSLNLQNYFVQLTKRKLEL